MKKEIVLLCCLFVVTHSPSQVPWATSGDNIFSTNANFVGIGTSAPTYKLDVFGPSGSWSGRFRGNTASNNSWGLLIDAGTSSSDAPFVIRNASQSQILFAVRGNGNIGIGTSSPVYKLDVFGPEGDWSGRIKGSASSNNSWGLLIDAGTSSSDAPLSIRNASQSDTYFTVRGNGNIGIGTPSPTEKLSVIGNISANGVVTAKKVVVTQLGWSDYVFNKEYKLRSLSSVESFIKQHKHLPDVPSAKDVGEQGISLSDNQALLLRKIEELTLYMIEMMKQIEQQKRQINQLKKRR